ncbi:unnamed protein product [Caenorhabditis nigoni]
MRAIQLVLFLSSLYFFNACLIKSDSQNDKCTPNDNTTYMIAYSNEVDSEFILKMLDHMPNFQVAPKFVKLARVRFDVQQPEEIEYLDNLDELISSTNNSLPDPSLSFSNTSTGSDIISVLEKFLEKTKSPICGSRINFLVKRLPTADVNIESIVAKLREFRVEVYFSISENTIGGNNFDILNEIAFKTNGVSMFFKDERVSQGVFASLKFSEDTLIYAANFNVSGKGMIELPPMTVPKGGRYNFLMSFKDDSISNAFQSSTITCTNTVTNHTFIDEYNRIFDAYLNSLPTSQIFDEGIYTMKLEYQYANQDIERLFIRVHTSGPTPPVDYWVPYDN